MFKHKLKSQKKKKLTDGVFHYYTTKLKLHWLTRKVTKPTYYSPKQITIPQVMS
jgi:hypothetical protein